MKKDSSFIRFVFLLGLLLVFCIPFIAQNPVVPAEESKNKKRVELLHADVGRANKNERPDVQVLVGNVRLRHDSMYMDCDSALIYEKSNSFEAFSNVRMEQGDTLFIYGDYLYYDGISKIAQLRRNVKMINRNTTLLTDSLNYDRVLGLGYYFDGGMLLDEENELTSDWGEYCPATKEAVFNHDVRLKNARFDLLSDTLHYNTATKVANILGPSEIFNEQNHIYSERGVYNTQTDQAKLLNRSVLTNGSKRLIGDSVFYDRRKGYGEAFNRVVMSDSINKLMLTGDYCFYNELTDSAFATKRAMAIDYSRPDSLFMHADTMMMVSLNVNTDSLYRVMRAYHKVRMYSMDMQGVCDSLAYISKDSCLTMYHDPILWNQNQQLLGERIHVYLNDSTINWVHIVNQTLSVEKKDSLHFNQVAGKEIKGYFKDGELYKADVIANVEVAFYLAEKDSSLIGLNTSVASLLTMYLENRQMKRVVLSPQPKAVVYPMDQIPPDKMKLKNFAWFDYVRPLSKDDIFNWRGKRAGEELIIDSRSEEDPTKGANLRDLIKMK